LWTAGLELRVCQTFPHGACKKSIKYEKRAQTNYSNCANTFVQQCKYILYTRFMTYAITNSNTKMNKKKTSYLAQEKGVQRNAVRKNVAFVKQSDEKGRNIHGGTIIAHCGDVSR